MVALCDAKDGGTGVARGSTGCHCQQSVSQPGGRGAILPMIFKMAPHIFLPSAVLANDAIVAENRDILF